MGARLFLNSLYERLPRFCFCVICRISGASLWGLAMDWLQNGWVTGIGGGVISGLIVYFITSWFFSNQSKRELNRKLALANQEVVLAVRQGVPEARVPTTAVLEALIKATARRHGVPPEELYGPSEVAQDLIKEVMDSSFISAETKEAYCQQLSELDKPEDAEPKTEAEREQRRYSSWRSLQTMALSITLALTTAVMSIALVFVTEREPRTSWSGDSFTISVLFPVLATAIGVVLSFLVLTLERMRRRRSLEAARREFEKGIKDAK